VSAGLLVVLYLLFSLNNDNVTNKRTQLIISAAASLQHSMELIQQDYEAKHQKVDLIFNYGSSGALQQQIQQGAPVDVFLSAGQVQMDRLTDLQLIKQSQTLMKNNLVVIISSNSKYKWNGLESLIADEILHIAIGQPESVPAGLYAEQALNNRQLWDQIEDKLIFAKDVRQVLSVVETGNAEVGFVYKTDAVGSKKVQIVEELSEDIHEPIVYPVGLLNTSKYPEEALAFYQYLLSEQASSVYTDMGFMQP
jgi:molybdate transport system substrate-binding protein